MQSLVTELIPQVVGTIQAQLDGQLSQNKGRRPTVILPFKVVILELGVNILGFWLIGYLSAVAIRSPPAVFASSVFFASFL